MKNKVTILFFVLFLGVIATNFGTKIVQAAGNYTDTNYCFQYSGDGSDVWTRARPKRDATSAYAKNTSTHCSHLISVCGTQNMNSTPGILNNCTYKAYCYEVPIGEARYLPNLVYERGYQYAYLVIQPNLHDPCVISGLWSPDSI